MKFVYCGYDFMIGTVERLIEDGHELTGIFSFPCDNVFNFNKRCEELAQRYDLPFTTDRITSEDIGRLISGGTQCFFAGGYPYKIPPIDETRAFGINLHPSRLPKGRGIMPTPYILLGATDAAGFTIHKLTPDFDAGDIVYQKAFTLTPQETVETYSARIALHAPGALSQIFADFKRYWQGATPQNRDEAGYFPMPDDKMRTIAWDSNIEEISTLSRAFGRFGVIAAFDNALWVVYNLNVWPEQHSAAPGTVMLALSREILIAAKNGFVCLTEFQKV